MAVNTSFKDKSTAVGVLEKFCTDTVPAWPFKNCYYKLFLTLSRRKEDKLVASFARSLTPTQESLGVRVTKETK